jgi:hypothetical protein
VRRLFGKGHEFEILERRVQGSRALDGGAPEPLDQLLVEVATPDQRFTVGPLAGDARDVLLEDVPKLRCLPTGGQARPVPRSSLPRQDRAAHEHGCVAE